MRFTAHHPIGGQLEEAQLSGWGPAHCNDPEHYLVHLFTLSGLPWTTPPALAVARMGGVVHMPKFDLFGFGAKSSVFQLSEKFSAGNRDLMPTLQLADFYLRLVSGGYNPGRLASTAVDRCG